MKTKKYDGLTNHTEDLVDHYWGTIDYLSSLVKSSELKAGLILSFYGILLNVIYQSTSNLEQDFTNNIPFVVLMSLWVICTAISIFFCIRCFVPKIEGNYDKNMFFFKDIISKYGNIKEFSKSFFETSVNEDLLFEQLGEQIYIISKIANHKFNNVKHAINLLAIGLVLFLIAGLYFYFFVI